MKEEPSDGPSVTLGEVLFAGRRDAVTPEHDWAGLVRAMAAGDQLALQALYGRTHRLVYTLIMRICGNRETAEELTVDVFHDVWRRASTYDADSGTVLAWIMNQARSRAIDRLRFEKRKKRVDPHGAIRHHEADRGVPADGADAAERALRLREALSTLSAEERRAVETAFFSGLTYSETATRLDQPLGTVKTRIRSAFVKLKKALDGGGGER